MEVVHIVRQYKPSLGGLEDAVHNLCAHLARRDGIKVRIVTLDRVFTNPKSKLPHHEIIEGIEVTRLSYVGSSRYPIAPQVLAAIRSADIVHVHAIDFFFDFLAWTRFLHRKPLVASTHGGFFHSSFASMLKKIYFATITRFSSIFYDVLCTSSENDARTFAQIAPTKIQTIENGVNVKKWANRGSVTPQRKMIFVGRWSENKAVPVLIDLIAVLKKLGYLWGLIIVGIPGEETKASLEEKARDRGVSAQVSVHEGVSEFEVGNLMGQTSYVASASRYEGFGISAVEGLSAGLIPLLSSIPPFDKLRQALGMGTIIDQNDLILSAQHIEKAHLELAEDCSLMREKCMAYAEQYDWDGVVERFVAVYNKILLQDSQEIGISNETSY